MNDMTTKILSVVALCGVLSILVIGIEVQRMDRYAGSTTPVMQQGSAVGVKLGVAENEANVRAEALNQKERELELKEEELLAREEEVENEHTSIEQSILYTTVIGGLLLLLVILNFSLDWKWREKRLETDITNRDEHDS